VSENQMSDDVRRNGSNWLPLFDASSQAGGGARRQRYMWSGGSGRAMTIKKPVVCRVGWEKIGVVMDEK